MRIRIQEASDYVDPCRSRSETLVISGMIVLSYMSVMSGMIVLSYTIVMSVCHKCHECWSVMSAGVS